MFSTKSLAAATAAFALFASSSADYSPSGKGNTAVYWGAGGNQEVLSAYCYDNSIDIIPVAFVNAFPPQANGLIGVGMASNTVNGSPKYKGPGYAGNLPDSSNDLLWTDCSPIASALYDCQQHTKTKFLLSLGGAIGTYNLNNASDGVYLANFLWGAFGPYDATWVANGGIRPFDVSSTETIEFDGFDFDIEIAPNSVAGYEAAVTQLRTLFAQYNKATGCTKEWLITAAPQCVLPDTNMSDLINAVAFDIVWVQFYNNPGCSARNWVANNAAGTSGFNFNKWESALALGASANAQLYIGLLGGPQGTTTTYAGDYLNPTEAKSLISAYASQSSFGGVMIWDAVSSDGSVAPLTGYSYRNDTPIPASAAYYDVVKDLLGAYITTTSSSTSSSSTPSPTSSSTIATYSAAPTTSSSSSSAAASSTSSSAPTTTGAPVHETSVTSNGITCQRIGCYTEGYNIRALTPIQVVNYTLMSPELCAAQCNLYPYAYMGVEYGGECYCGNQINNGSTLVADSDCSMPCDGVPGEYCGAGNRLDMYSCGPAGGYTPSSSSVSSTSSPAASTSSAAATTSYPATSPSSSSSPAPSSSSPAASTSYPATSPSSSSSAAASTSYPASSPSSSSPSYTPSPSPSSSSMPAASSSSAPYYPSNSTSSPVYYPTGSSSSIASSSSAPYYPTNSTSSPVYSPSGSSSPSSSSSAPYYPTSSTITSSPYPTTSSPGGAAVSTSSYPATITSTYTTTTVRTITSCASTVTNCPANQATHTYVVTDTIEQTTTYCPGNSVATSSPAVATSYPAQYTTSTVYTTTVYTITSCAPTVTNCPAKIGQVTTDTIIDYTTICPVTATAVTTPSETDTYSTWTTSSTTTQYVTIKVVASTATLAPYPASSPASILTLNKGAASGTLPAVYLTTTTAKPSQFTGAASASRGPVAVVLAMALGAVVFLL